MKKKLGREKVKYQTEYGEEECFWPANAEKGPVIWANDVKAGPGASAPCYPPMRVFNTNPTCRYCGKPIYLGGIYCFDTYVNCMCNGVPQFVRENADVGETRDGRSGGESDED